MSYVVDFVDQKNHGDSPASCDDTQSFCESTAVAWRMVDGSEIQKQPCGMYKCIKNPVNNRDKLPTSAG